jgi:hypothetical protein
MSSIKDTFNFMDLSYTPIQLTPPQAEPDNSGLPDVETFDIKETKEMLLFIIALFRALKMSISDGKITFFDLQYFLNVILRLPAACSGIQIIPAEIHDLSQEEISELLALCVSELSMDDFEGTRFLNTILSVVNTFKTIF